jgi:hypothetical protein
MLEPVVWANGDGSPNARKIRLAEHAAGSWEPSGRHELPRRAERQASKLRTFYW